MPSPMSFRHGWPWFGNTLGQPLGGGAHCQVGRVVHSPPTHDVQRQYVSSTCAHCSPAETHLLPAATLASHAASLSQRAGVLLQTPFEHL